MDKLIRTISSIAVSTTGDVLIRIKGATKAIEAKALESKIGDNESVNYLLLDRLIHAQSEDVFLMDTGLNCIEPSYKVSGAYVTELCRGCPAYD